MRSTAFSVPGLPPSLNAWSRKDWRTRATAARDWRTKVWAYARKAHAQPIMDVPVVVTLTFWSGRSKDPDNHAKFVLDALVGVLIRDDRFPYLYELRMRNRIETFDRDRVEIELEEAVAVEGDVEQFRLALERTAGENHHGRGPKRPAASPATS